MNNREKFLQEYTGYILVKDIDAVISMLQGTIENLRNISNNPECETAKIDFCTELAFTSKECTFVLFNWLPKSDKKGD